jgi:hypothetical protein
LVGFFTDATDFVDDCRFVKKKGQQSQPVVPHCQLFEASGKSGQGCTDKVRRKIVHKIRGIRKKNPVNP